MLSFCTCTEQERASGRSLSQVLVAADPLAVVAAQGQAMWDPVGWTAGRGGVGGGIRRGCGRRRGGALPDSYLVVALGRLGPEDIAAATLVLASPASSWITGVTLDIAAGKIMP